jgi:hypothetical protein
MPTNMPQPHGDARLKCGQCRWFVQMVSGKTCRDSRQVLPDTRACVEHQAFRPSPFDFVKNDKFILDVRSKLLVWTEQSIKKVDQEIKTYRVLRNVESLKDPMAYIEEGKLAELGQRLETIQVYSERLLDIRFDLKDKRTELQSIAKDVQAYLFAEYRDAVQSLKNDSERATFFRHATPELSQALDKIENLYDKAETAYQILKDSHYAMSKKIEAVLEIYKARIHSVSAHNRSVSIG